MGRTGEGTLAKFFPKESLAEVLEYLFENASDAIYILDTHGKFVAVNHKAEELTGFKREDFIGKSFRKIIPIKSLPKTVKGFLDVIRGKPIRLELELKTAAKGTVPVEVTSAPLIINERAVGTFGIVREITERVLIEKELRATSKQLEMVLETAMEGVTLVDSEENLTFVNRAFADMLGYEEDELLGMNLRKLVDEESFKELRRRTEARKKGKPSRYELVLLRKDGKPCIVQVSAAPLWNDDGSFAGSVGIVMDVTARKKAEKDVLESQQKFKGFFLGNPEAAVYVNPDFHVLDINPRFEELFGYSLDEIKDKHINDVVVPKDLIEEAEMMDKNAEKGYVYYDTMRKKKNGSLVPVSISAAPIIVEGQLIGYVGIYKDLTERKAMEEKLRRILDSSPDAITVSDLNGNIIDCNEATLELHGYSSKTEIIGKNALESIAKKDHKKAMESLKETLKQGSVKNVEYILLTKDGHEFPAELSASVIRDSSGEPLGFVAITKSITERKQMEETLRKSEEKFRNIFESANDCMIYLDRSGRILDVNGKAVEVFGGSKEELLGKHFTRIGVFSLTYMPRLLSDFAKVLAGKKSSIVIRIKNRMGKSIYLDCSGSVAKIDDKQVGVLVIARDVTERKNIEEALRDSEERFRAITTSAKDAIVMADNEGKISYWNPAAEEIFGYTKEEAIGKEMYTLIAPHPFREGFMKEFGQFAESGKGTLVGKTVELPFVRKDGTEFPIELSISAMQIKGRWHAVGVLRDVTERRQMQKKLEEYSQHLEELVEKRTRQLKEAHERILKAERLAAIGQVAAMVGHDLRNPLTGIAGATYFLKTRFGPKMDKKTGEMLEIIEKDIEHSNKIINDLLDYSREAQLELTETTPKSILKEALSLVEVPKSIQIIDLTQDETRIRVDVDKIKRVFVNLIKNSIDAMPKGGKLTIKSTKLDSKLEIVFSDTGMGMPKETLEKIWTPLFTTKAKGMGLGLPICKRIIEAHRGTISVESTVGKGTTFALAIPIEPKPEKEGGEKIWVNEPESLLSTTTRA
jgi:PAS domain S-box-containing protein